MPSRQLQAEVVRASWAVGEPGEESQAATALGPNIESLIVQFQVSAGQNLAASPLMLSLEFAGDSTRELGALLTQIAGGEDPAAAGAAGAGHQSSRASGLALAPVLPRGIAGGSSVESDGLGTLFSLSSAAAYEPVAAVPRAREHSSQVAGASATARPMGAGTRPAVRAAVGSSAGSAASPTVAMLALLTLCLAPVLLLGRLALDPFSCKSALLTSRLERPG